MFYFVENDQKTNTITINVFENMKGAESLHFMWGMSVIGVGHKEKKFTTQSKRNNTKTRSPNRNYGYKASNI